MVIDSKGILIIDKDCPCHIMGGMPSRYRIKNYLEGGFYHVFNRGVERRRIFMDDNDYNAFLHLLEFFISKQSDPTNHPLAKLNGYVPPRIRPLATFPDSVEIHSYCLMPNHFHILLRQKEKDGMQRLMRKLLTTYAMYFNRRYERVGHLFQGPYKASLVDKDEYLIHLSRYIHQNPSLTKSYLNQYPYSSYPYYIGEKNSDWLKTDFILDYFRENKNKSLGMNGFSNYKEFTEGFENEPREIISHLTID